MAQTITPNSLRLRSAYPRKIVMASRESSELSQEEVDRIDPFTYTPPFTPCQKFLVFFNALWLAPIRLLFIVVPMVIVGTVTCLIALIGDKYDYDHPTPLGKWGRFIHERVNPSICRWFLFGFGFHWIHYKGTPAPATEAPIFVVAPHTSMLDIFVMVLFGVHTFVAKEETGRTPFFGPIITRSVRAIYVSREDAGSRSKSADEIRRRTHTKGGWPHVLLYPEGTTTNKRVLLKYKPGAFAPKLPVQPVLIKYNNKLDTTSWGGDGVGLIGTLFYTMCQFHNSLEVEFLPVYHPSQAEMDDPKLYADNVQRFMARELNIPAGEQSIEDLFLMKHARSLGLPFSKGMVVYYKTSKKTGLRVREMKHLLTRFAAMDRDKDGLIEAEDLASFLSVPMDTCLQAIFDHCKKMPEGKVSFAEYLCGVIRESRQLLENRQFMQEMFDFFDRDHDGRISLDDITQTLPIGKLPPANQDDLSLSSMNSDDFKSLLLLHPEYVVLFHEYQNAGISCPYEDTSLNGDISSSREDSPNLKEHQITHCNSSLAQYSNTSVHMDSQLPGCVEVEA